MITISIGDEDQKINHGTFVVHKGLLMSTSSLFAKGLSGNFIESHTGVFRMPEEDAATFSLFVQWLYFGKLFVKTTTELATNDQDEEWLHLPRLYTLGERLDAPKFKDAVVSAIIEKVNETEVMPVNWADYVYGNTVSACGLRRLLVDFHVHAHRGNLLQKNASPDVKEPSVDFLQDAISRMVEIGSEMFKDVDMPWIVNPCRYHEHEGVSCEQD